MVPGGGGSEGEERGGAVGAVDEGVDGGVEGAGDAGGVGRAAGVGGGGYAADGTAGGVDGADGMGVLAGEVGCEPADGTSMLSLYHSLIRNSGSWMSFRPMFLIQY
jgi:hypothetical protein